ncbi:FHA domain-containing protein [Leucobacter allii]|uniref:FHA domain-containing protein n=1 Tax=Leucobacter allii TaxID=2932247 RepID=A0ABY4FK19_9MICO|nr:FtsK/SpoIIIE domain-containing protein [Leucobacter allii]UOQ56477.1 FHA domain-containing protein [Leucobacter allii]
MRLLLTLALPDGRTHDVALSCDVTATVADAARTLVRAGIGTDHQLVTAVRSRAAPVTLRGRPAAGAPPRLLDPASPIGSSGLRSGWIVEPVLEFGAHGGARRMIGAVGSVEVLSGRHTGTRYSLVPGENLIGRDRACRVHLSDPSVSRRHAVVAASAGLELADLGAANGVLRDGRPVGLARIDAATTFQLGEVEIRITPGPPAEAVPYLPHRIPHVRAPRIDPRFPRSERELPDPPERPAPGRFPVLAALAPLLLGGAMYAVTRSPLSLVLVALSPLMMIGSWWDARLGTRRRLRRETRRFDAALAVERAELTELRAREIAVRAAEAPTLPDIARAIRERGELLWTRRPEHDAYLEVRLGEGARPSRTAIVLPPRAGTAAAPWALLRGVAEEFRAVEPVPVLERLDRCGSLGIAGPAFWAAGLARSLVLQLAGLHSPEELGLCCFAGPEHAGEWDWLKWLPHAGTAGPLPGGRLADDAAGSRRLLAVLEGTLVERRARTGAAEAVRARLEPERADDAPGAAARDLPTVPTILVLVLPGARADPSRLIALAEDGPDRGIHLIWVGAARTELPAACRTFVEVDDARAVVSFVRTAETVPLQRWEHLEAPAALELARSLAPVEDAGARALDESDLPASVALRQLHEVDLLGGASAIARAWAASGTLVSRWTRGSEREPPALAAVVGQGADGPTTIDLRAQGPHALVGGTTGSGKSEFLQSWIMSLAARIGPDRLTFLLVDYKGGAAFAECADLPHAVGLVTDLGPHLVRRALTSLRAELRHREELLAAHGAKDLLAMERRSDPAAPPVLVIVIDEFAALAREIPEFVDGVIDIAQRGRSLGLHLIMATQRPAGVISDNLRANTNLRIALRVADASDSRDVLGVADAASFDATTPGRGAIVSGPGRIDRFQTGYLGGRSGASPLASRIEVRSLGLAEGRPWDIPPEPAEAAGTRARPARDIAILRDGIAAAARLAGLRAPRRPWLDELPRIVDLGAIAACTVRAGPADAADPAGDPAADPAADPELGDAVTIGLRDEPAAQARSPLVVDLEDAGHLAVFGASGTGKTSALCTLAVALSRGADRRPVELYAIDAAGGALDAIAGLPTVGAVAPLADAELVGRILRRLLAVIAERGPRFSAARAAGLPAYRATPGGGREPRVVLLVDGFDAFRHAAEAVGGDATIRMLQEIMTTGRSHGVHVVLTAERAAAVPAALAASVGRRIVLRLANPHDYAALGLPVDALDDAGPGRGVLAGAREEIQIALVGGRPELAAQAEALDALGAELGQRGVPAAFAVRNAPRRIPLAELPAETGGRPVVGIDTRDFRPVGMPTEGLVVISGPPGSGQSTAAGSAVAALRRWSGLRGERIETTLLSCADGGLLAAQDWDRAASGTEEVRTLGEALLAALGAGPAPGARGVIVVERPTDVEGTAALPVLVALAKAARRARALVVFEFEQGAAAGIWELFTALRQPRWGIALQPDAAESQTPFRESFGRVSRADFPPGRGFAVEGGRLTPVHIAAPWGEPGAAP